MEPPAKRVRLLDRSVPDEQFFGSPNDMIFHKHDSPAAIPHTAILHGDDGPPPFLREQTALYPDLEEQMGTLQKEEEDESNRHAQGEETDTAALAAEADRAMVYGGERARQPPSYFASAAVGDIPPFRHDSIDNSVFECPLCEKQFTGFLPYYTHLDDSGHHMDFLPKALQDQATGNKSIPAPINFSAAPQFQCGLCKMEFETFLDLTSHVTVFRHYFPASRPGKPFTKQQKAQKAFSKANRFVCITCQRGFYTNEDCFLHLGEYGHQPPPESPQEIQRELADHPRSKTAQENINQRPPPGSAPEIPTRAAEAAPNQTVTAGRPLTFECARCYEIFPSHLERQFHMDAARHNPPPDPSRVHLDYLDLTAFGPKGPTHTAETPADQTAPASPPSPTHPICPICGTSFDSWDEIIHHWNEGDHKPSPFPDPPSPPTPIATPEAMQRVEQLLNSYCCPICKRAFPSDVELKVHIGQYGHHPPLLPQSLAPPALMQSSSVGPGGGPLMVTQEVAEAVSRNLIREFRSRGIARVEEWLDKLEPGTNPGLGEV